MTDRINDSTIVAALGRQMTQAVQRQMLAASNLANADTPDYQGQHADFSSALAQQVAGIGMAATNAGHLSTSSAGDLKMSQPADLSPQRDGNNVEIDRELLDLGQAAADFSAAQTALAAKFRLVRYAINDGK